MYYGYYQATKHLIKRYRNRMSKNSNKQRIKKELKKVSDEHINKRINYMLLFSIHGKPGYYEHTEVRYYFEWNIVVDHKQKTIVTMYVDHNRKLPPVHKFGDRRLRKLVYNLWFKPNSEIRKKLTTSS